MAMNFTDWNHVLAHHGIKGQKWGVRRFQNVDGTLTAEGKAHYRNHSNDLAQKIHRNASLIEPRITKDVQSVVTHAGARMYGLEHRLKTKESLARKIRADSKEKGISQEEAANGIKDSVRYTSLAGDRNFVSSYNSVKSALAKKGYEEVRCRNYFDLYRKGEAKHKQVTSVFKDKKGNTFELQFHTESSIKAKEAKTPLYEEARKTGTSEKRKNPVSSANGGSGEDRQRSR